VQAIVQPLVTQVITLLPDIGRHPTLIPGRLVYSARMDRDKLACFYRTCLYCATEAVTKRSILDVYSNGIMMNLPIGCCCCCWQDRGSFFWFDNNVVFGEPEVAECFANPRFILAGLFGCPFYWCPHCCGICGESILFTRSCGCPNGIGHVNGLGPCCCCPIDVVYGLAQGEAQQLKGIIMNTLINFRMNGGGSTGQTVLAGMQMPMA